MRFSLHLAAAILLLPSSALHAQNPTLAFPNNYKLLLDNSTVAVIRAHYGPHEKVGVHDHSAFSTVYIYLNDSGPVLFTHYEAHLFSITRPPTHAGALRVSPGRHERHSVENLGDTPSDYLRVELKHVPIKALPAEARIPAPKPPLQPGTSVEYNNPRLHIERIVCAANQPCNLPANATSSVLVAITTQPVHTIDTGPSLNFDDPVAWLPANQSIAFTPSSSTIQLLRLEIP
jgi:hypothetical protein